MTVFVNHKEVQVKEFANLDYLLESLNLSKDGLALAIDNKVIPKNNWGKFELNDNMMVTVIRATQGG